MIKKVEVIADMLPTKGVTPLKIVWEDGRIFEIDKVKEIRKMASTKGGGVGLRYSCKIQGKDKYLFFDDDVWFVEI